MKLQNYDIHFLIQENLKKTVVKEIPTTFSKTQYQILYKLIIRKKITKKFFYYLLENLYGLNDWKLLNYNQMYQMISILTNWNYEGRI